MSLSKSSLAFLFLLGVIGCPSVVDRGAEQIGKDSLIRVSQLFLTNNKADASENFDVCTERCGDANCRVKSNGLDVECFCDHGLELTRDKKACTSAEICFGTKVGPIDFASLCQSIHAECVVISGKVSCKCKDGYEMVEQQKCTPKQKTCEEKKIAIPNSDCEGETLKCKCWFKEEKNAAGELTGCKDEIQNSKVCEKDCGVAICKRKGECDTECSCPDDLKFTADRKACTSDKLCEETEEGQLYPIILYCETWNANCAVIEGKAKCVCKEAYEGDGKGPCTRKCDREIDNAKCVDGVHECMCGFDPVPATGALQSCTENLDKLCLASPCLGTGKCKRSVSDDKSTGYCQGECDCVDKTKTYVKAKGDCFSNEQICNEKKQAVAHSKCSEKFVHECQCDYTAVKTGDDITKCEDAFEQSKTCLDACGKGKCRRTGADLCKPECYCEGDLQFHDEEKVCMTQRMKDCKASVKSIPNAICSDEGDAGCKCYFTEVKDGTMLKECKDVFAESNDCLTKCGKAKCVRDGPERCTPKCTCEGDSVLSKDEKNCLTKKQSCEETPIVDADCGDDGTARCRCHYKPDNDETGKLKTCTDKFANSEVCMTACGFADCRRKPEPNSCEPECFCANAALVLSLDKKSCISAESPKLRVHKGRAEAQMRITSKP